MPTKKTNTESGAAAKGKAAAKKPAKAAKPASKRNNVSTGNEKVSKSSGLDKANVKSPPNSSESTGSRVRARGYVRMTDAVIDNIIDLLHTHSLSEICNLPGMPDRTTFSKRLAADVELQKRYALACEARADKFVDEIIQIADDGANDTYLDEDGNKRTDHDVIARSKLRVDARKWAAAKMAPKKYGERVGVDHGVQEGNPLASLLAKVAGTALPIASNLPDDED